MIQLLNLPMSSAYLRNYGGVDGLRRELTELNCHGIEGIWAGEETVFPADLVPGYHLTFYPDWLDFYHEDKTALLAEFGSMETVISFYGGLGAERLLTIYREDLARAKALGVRYVVFHVSNVSIEEGYTYCWRHSHEEVIDTAAEIVNLLLADETGGFDFLMENQWWPGLTMTDPALTERLLSAVKYPRKGLLLDTGHLMNANPALATQQEGIAYIHRMLDQHGDLCRYIRGVHLHQSLSGAYVRAHTGCLPGNLPEDYLERFSTSYQHILKIDQHRPWTDPGIVELVERIGPAYLTHELAADGPTDRHRAVLCQQQALGW